jgi:hypothetical protein
MYSYYNFFLLVVINGDEIFSLTSYIKQTGDLPDLMGSQRSPFKTGALDGENLGELLETDHQRIDGGFLKWGIPKTIAFKWFQY